MMKLSVLTTFNFLGNIGRTGPTYRLIIKATKMDQSQPLILISSSASQTRKLPQSNLDYNASPTMLK